MPPRSKKVTFSSFHLRECQISSCALIIAFSCIKGITGQIDPQSNGAVSLGLHLLINNEAS